MLGLLSSALGYAPNVALNGDGEPTFTVMRGDFELQVSMASDSEAVYLVAYGSEERAGLAEFDGRYLPAELQTALSELRHIAV